MGARVQASTWGRSVEWGPSNRKCYFVQDPHEEAKDSPKTFEQEMDISEVIFWKWKRKITKSLFFLSDIKIKSRDKTTG